MVNDIFGGLVKGLGAFMPKDDPNTILFQTQSELSDLENRIQEIYAEIGKKVFHSISEKPEYSELVSELNYTKKKLESVKLELQSAQDAKVNQERIEQESLQSRTCPNCDTINPEGVKFCQECGSRLVSSDKLNCPGCGAQNPSGTRFCGECGVKL